MAFAEYAWSRPGLSARFPTLSPGSRDRRTVRMSGSPGGFTNDRPTMKTRTLHMNPSSATLTAYGLGRAANRVGTPWAASVVAGIVMLAAALHASSSQATIIASDSAANSTYSSFITVNGGTGFQLWTSSLTGGGGSYRGTTGLGATTFGIYAGGGAGNSFSAYRAFDSALTVSSTFSVDVGTTSINNGGSVGVLFYAGSQERGVLFFAGGTSFWQWNDGGGAVTTTIPFGSVNLDLARLSTNGYSLALAQGATTQTISGSFLSSGNPVSSAITEVGFYSSAQGINQNFGFNNLEIAVVPEPHTALIVGAGACAMIPVFLRRRPNR